MPTISDQLPCDIQVEEPLYTKEELDKFKVRREKFEQARKLMNHLGIKYGYTESDAIDIVSLYNILTDDEKVKELVSQLKLKLFW